MTTRKRKHDDTESKTEDEPELEPIQATCVHSKTMIPNKWRTVTLPGLKHPVILTRRSQGNESEKLTNHYFVCVTDTDKDSFVTLTDTTTCQTVLPRTRLGCSVSVGASYTYDDKYVYILATRHKRVCIVRIHPDTREWRYIYIDIQIPVGWKTIRHRLDLAPNGDLVLRHLASNVDVVGGGGAVLVNRLSFDPDENITSHPISANMFSPKVGANDVQYYSSKKGDLVSVIDNNESIRYVSHSHQSRFSVIHDMNREVRAFGNAHNAYVVQYTNLVYIDTSPDSNLVWVDMTLGRVLHKIPMQCIASVASGNTIHLMPLVNEPCILTMDTNHDMRCLQLGWTSEDKKRLHSLCPSISSYDVIQLIIDYVGNAFMKWMRSSPVSITCMDRMYNGLWVYWNDNEFTHIEHLDHETGQSIEHGQLRIQPNVNDPVVHDVLPNGRPYIYVD